MKFLKHLFPLLTLLVLMSCEKFKLEDDEKGKLLIGKWKYTYSGYHTSSIDFVRTLEPYEDFEIEFLEGGKICINDEGEIAEYRIRNFGELVNNSYAAWRAQLSYGKEKDKLYFRLHYYNNDSVGIEQFPHPTPYAPSEYNGFNMFKRIE